MHPTRGHGVLEGLLAQLRGRLARRHLPASVADGRILDIGCGGQGWFLKTVRAREREGLDRICRAVEQVESLPQGGQLRLQQWSAAQGRLPFASEWFDAIVMLAVVEHCSRVEAETLLQDVYRVLKPGGRCIITTPSSGTERLLHLLARMGMVSHEEIDEHHAHFTLPELRQLCQRSGFPGHAICSGRFEFGMNLWLAAEKPVDGRGNPGYP